MISYFLSFPGIFTVLKSLVFVTKLALSFFFNPRVWFHLSKKFVLVTQISTKLDEEILRLLIKKNAKIIVLGKSQARLEEIKNKYPNVYIHTHAVNLNFTRDFSFLDNYDIGLIIHRIGDDKPIHKHFTDEDAEYLFDTHLKSPMILLQYVVANMIEKNRGYVMTIGQGFSIKPVPHMCIDYAIRAAYKAWAESLYYELQRYNVNVEYMDVSNELIHSDPKNINWLFLPTRKDIAESLFEAVGSSYYTIPNVMHFVYYLLLFLTPGFIIGRFRSFRNMYSQGKLLGNC